jgi:LacI family transcriptional regulator
MVFSLQIKEIFMQTRTLHDVAKAAKVSPSTVSRILNGTAVVSVEKRKSVEDAIARLGYRPNFMAQALAKGRSMMVGVVTQSISSPFYGETFVGIEQGLAESGYHPMFISAHWQIDDEREAIEMLTARRADGLIVLGGNLEDGFLSRVAHTLPLVTVGRLIHGLEHQSVQINQEAGAVLGMRHLLELGHRRIAHITGPGFHRDANERLLGYQKALAEAGIAFDPNLVVEGTYQERGGLLATEQLLSRNTNFSAIFCANDQTAFGARLALHRRGIRVPEDMSLIGFDDLFVSSYTTPPLTTVRQPSEEMGMAAAKLILGLLEQRPQQPISLNPSLVLRESTARIRFS